MRPVAWLPALVVTPGEAHPLEELPLPGVAG
jgi:hypothetical protein